MSVGGANEPGAVRTVPGWAKLLIGFHVFASLVWALPRPPENVANDRVRPQATTYLLYWNNKYLKTFKPIQGYILSIGAWQYWDMFAPDPSNTDWYCTADVTYRDGTTKTIAYPRMYELPIPLKYVKERYRKYFERAHDPANARVFPPFAQTMALMGYTDRNNPPIVVRLKSHSLRIAAPGQPQGTQYDEVEYFAYAVDQRWLRRAAGEQ